MDEKSCLFLGLILYFSIISESRVLRDLPRDGSSGNGEIPLSMNPLEGKKLGPPTRPGDYDYYFQGPPDPDRRPIIDPSRRPADNDYNEPDSSVNKEDNLPERFPLVPELDERPPEEKYDTDEPDDENFIKPIDKEDTDNSVNNDKDFGSSAEDEKPIRKDDDESEESDINPEESEEDSSEEKNKSNGGNTSSEESEKNNIDKEKKPDEEESSDEERKEEEEKHELENGDEKKYIPEEEKHEHENGDEKKYIPEEESADDNSKEEEFPKGVDEETVDQDNEKKYIPDEESDKGDNEEEIPKEVDEETDNENNNEDDESIHKGEDADFLSGDSIFDTPFFNLGQVKKYFGQLDRALGHVFRQTVDEALLLNGTYANTTEEEVDIDGKKYIVTKSIIKGRDNHSSIYVEALSSKPKMNDSEVMKDIEIKNVTET